jgi:pantetheine-phosphate adenylyltransferase
MSKIAVFPGSFDPITMGHYSIIMRGSNLFDKVIVALGTNTSKKYLFDKEKRFKMLQTAFSGYDNITVQHFDGLTVDFCKANNASFILRGLRNGIDFEYEKSIAEMNRSMRPDIETVFMNTEPQFGAISSSIVRELIKNDADVSAYLPKGIDLK